MSKHLRNYPDVRNGVTSTVPTPSLVPYVVTVLRGGNLIVTAEGIRDTVRQVMLPGVELYQQLRCANANAANGEGRLRRRQLRADEVASAEMDRYLLAAPWALEADESGARLSSGYDACDAASDFIDVLTNWYMLNTTAASGRTRTRSTRCTPCLGVFMRVLAPLLPMESNPCGVA